MKIELLVYSDSNRETQHIPLEVSAIGYSNGTVDSISVTLASLVSALKKIKTESGHARRVPKQQKRTRKAIRKVR